MTGNKHNKPLLEFFNLHLIMGFIVKKVGGYWILFVTLHPNKNYTIVCGITRQ